MENEGTTLVHAYKATILRAKEALSNLLESTFEEENADAGGKEWTYLYPFIKAEGLTFFFHPSITVHLVQDGEYWLAKNSDFDVESISPTIQGAVENLGAEIAFLWDHLALERDENLTQDAKALKAKLRKQIKIAK